MIETGFADTSGLSMEAVTGSLRGIMPIPALAQADLFGTDHRNHEPSRTVVVTIKDRRATSTPDLEGAARLLDDHGDYRVLRRLRPRPVYPR